MGNENNAAVVQALKAFLAADKYELYEEWSPGDCTNDEDKKQVNDFLNACTQELLACSGDSTTAKFPEILNRYSEEVAGLVPDTEDREFVQEVLMRLAAMAGVEGLYATQNPVTAFLDSFKGVPVRETIARQCMECGCWLRVDIQARIDVAPALWVITRCNTCDAIDYIELPAGLLQFSAEGFTWIETIEQTLYDRTDVIARLNHLLEQGMLLNGSTVFRYLK